MEILNRIRTLNMTKLKFITIALVERTESRMGERREKKILLFRWEMKERKQVDVFTMLSWHVSDKNLKNYLCKCLYDQWSVDRQSHWILSHSKELTHKHKCTQWIKTIHMKNGKRGTKNGLHICCCLYMFCHCCFC